MTSAGDAGKTTRQLHRERTEAELLTIARRHLGEVGAAGLSLRAIAREMGLVSSAVYRYFPSRDALLTTLILEAYNELGSHVESAEICVDRVNYRGRFTASALAMREWALDNRHRYALIYGSPVPGYAAPTDTVAAAARVGLVLVGVLSDALRAGHAATLTPALETASPAVAELSSILAAGLPPHLLALGVESWTRLHGVISFEVFGQYNRMVLDTESFYALVIDEVLSRLNLPR
ncbi:TetR/AcrR family transcriptional regulator [Klugiella xanthotipulae]|uniref:TetR family transcriptional regulator n=1 Tax=Klugiella xanthotipulae TaxID=244735 RepID=A0A543I5M8_9MICO|nr:TetR/AcrR family transcriptional regulator [Klugiella xanthotipulae]TQM65913.1 TetR family transcriptional regulator [Klugiella xanthotipulae]